MTEQEPQPLALGGIFGEGEVATSTEAFAIDTRAPSERLKEVRDELERGGLVSVTVRELLLWFGASRRGSRVVDEIRLALDAAMLTTEPDFEAAFIDSQVHFRSKVHPPISAEGHVVVPVSVEATATIVPLVGQSSQAEHSDPTFRLSKLEAANRAPVYVKPDASLAEAVTKMLKNDYSQLPVMQNEREVKGAITWRSIASRQSLGQHGTTAKDFMDQVDVLDSDASLFDAIRIIIDRQYVLVRGSDKRISGIVTSSDLAGQFQLLTEPFLLLAEIENAIRRAIASRFTAEQLSAAKDPADVTRKVNTVHDMTFGEYVRLLENPGNWHCFAPTLDRNEFVGTLRRIGTTRNDIMHFDPDGIEPAELEVLRDFSKFLRRLHVLGAM